MSLKSNGSLWCWGRNTFGQLGEATTTNRSAPIKVGSENVWVDIAGSLGSSFGLKADGTAWAWGMNNLDSWAMGLTLIITRLSLPQINLSVG